MKRDRVCINGGGGKGMKSKNVTEIKGIDILTNKIVTCKISKEHI